MMKNKLYIMVIIIFVLVIIWAIWNVIVDTKYTLNPNSDFYNYYHECYHIQNRPKEKCEIEAVDYAREQEIYHKGNEK